MKYQLCYQQAVSCNLPSPRRDTEQTTWLYFCICYPEDYLVHVPTYCSIRFTQQAAHHLKLVISLVFCCENLLADRIIYYKTVVTNLP